MPPNSRSLARRISPTLAGTPLAFRARRLTTLVVATLALASGGCAARAPSGAEGSAPARGASVLVSYAPARDVAAFRDDAPLEEWKEVTQLLGTVRAIRHDTLDLAVSEVRGGGGREIVGGERRARVVVEDGVSVRVLSRHPRLTESVVLGGALALLAGVILAVYLALHGANT